MKQCLSPSLIVVVAVAGLCAACSPDAPDTQESTVAPVRGEKIEALVAAEPEPPRLAEDMDKPIDSEVASASVGETSAANDKMLVEEADDQIDSASRETLRSDGQDYISVGFDFLASYEFEMTDDLLEASEESEDLTRRTNSMIPENVRELNASAVAVKGYMLPLKVENGRVQEFLLMRDQSMCCFGTVPKINEWVSVKTIGAGVEPIIDEPVTIFGKLHVGEIRENGYLVGIYRMDGEKLAGPLDL